MPYEFEIYSVPEELSAKELSVWEMRSIYEGMQYGNCLVYETSIAIGNPSVMTLSNILQIPLSMDDSFNQVDAEWLDEVNKRYKVYLNTNERNSVTEKVLTCLNQHLTSPKTLIIYTG